MVARKSKGKRAVTATTKATHVDEDEEFEIHQNGHREIDAADPFDDIDTFMKAREDKLEAASSKGRKVAAVYEEEEEEEEEEVFGLDVDDDEEEEEEDEEEEELDNLGLEKKPQREISLKAWGRNKKPFYGADVGDDELSSDEDVAEEETEVKRLQQERLKSLKNEDFELDDSFESLAKEASSSKKKATSKKQKAKPVAPEQEQEIEQIERDLSGLSTDELLEMVQQDSPELLQLLADLKDKADTIRQHLAPLLDQAREGRVKTNRGISLLDVKYQLLLSYCTNICFYIYLKTSGASVKDHPVLLQLIEQRALMEKLKPLENKARYQIDKLVKAASTDPSHLTGDDPTRYRPNPSSMASTRHQNGGDEAEVYKAPKITPVPYEGAKDKAQRKLEREKSRAATTRILRDLQEEFSEQPEQIVEEDDAMVDTVALARERYEEDNFVRLPETRKDKLQKRKRLEQQFRNEFEDLNDFAMEGGDVDDEDPLRLLKKTRKNKKDVEEDNGHENGEEDDDVDEESASYYNKVKAAKQQKKEAKEKEDDGETLFGAEEEKTQGKRGATYQIIKNKGMTVKRKKEQRNPRVKRRVKYEQAQKKLKSAGMRVVEREIKPYGGELTGIKKNISRSVQLK